MGNQINWEVIAALSTTFTAIMSPVITALINNHYQRKIYNAKFYYERRAMAIENFIETAGKYIKHESLSNKSVFGQSSKELYLYLPEELWKYIDDINSAFSQNNLSLADKHLTEFCKKLSEYPPRFKV